MRRRLLARGARPARPGPRDGDPGQAPAQVDHRRVVERHRGEDLAAVEPDQRDAERQQHQQVEGAPAQQVPRPGERQQRDQEQGAQRQPDLGVGDRPAERAVVAARHGPRDLRPHPHLGDLAAGVGHQDLGLDGLRPVVVLADPEGRVDAGLLVELHRGARDLAVLDPVLQLPRGPGDREDLVLGQRRLRVALGHPEGLLDVGGLPAHRAHDAVGGAGRLGRGGVGHRPGRGPGRGRRSREKGGGRHRDGDAPLQRPTGRTSGG